MFEKRRRAMAQSGAVAAGAALLALNERSAERNTDINNFGSVPEHDDSDEDTSDCPLFDAFYEVSGNSSIIQITNFTATEFMDLWSELEGCIDASSKQWAREALCAQR